MKTLHGHLVRQVAATLLMTIAVFSFVLLLGNVLKEVLVLLVSQKAPLPLVLEALALLVPYSISFSLPLAVLTTTLLVFGRFSADQELTAARASGISLLSLVSPVILLSVLLSLVSAWINLQIAPAARLAYKSLLVRFIADQPFAPFVSGRFVTEFPGVVIYVGAVKGNVLEDVLFYELSEDRIVRDLRAKWGTFAFDETNRVVTLHFDSATVLYWVPRQPAETNAAGAESPGGAGIAAANQPAAAGSETGALSTALSISNALGSLDGYWLPVTATGLSAEFSFDKSKADPSRRKAKYSEMTFWQLVHEKRFLAAQGIRNTNPIAVHLHRQVSMSLACIGFCLVGIPLGIRAHRRETTAGIAMALCLALAYYGFIILGEALATRSGMLPLALVWAPTFLFQIVGMILLYRANKN